MNITVTDLSSVDKELILTATREELQPAFDKAYKKVRNQVTMPGFRAGKVPMDMVKKRFGKDIEQDEVRTYVFDVYNDKLMEEYKPIGETQFKEINWANDELKAVILIGIEPKFELKDLASVSLDRLVHDVTDEDVDKELDFLLEKEGSWSTVEQAATESNRLILDIFAKDHEGNLLDKDVDPDQEMDLRDAKNAEYKPFLLGTVAGDEVDAEIKHGDHSHQYKLVVKEVQSLVKPEISNDLIEKFSNGEYTSVDDYRAFLKSRVQEYYDKTSDDMIKGQLMSELTKLHEFEVPATLIDLLVKRYVEDLKKQYKITTEIDPAAFRDDYLERAQNEAKWYFITQKLNDKFSSEVEISADDVDSYFERQATQMGYPVEMLKNAYASNPNELETLKLQIREEKVYDKALELVKIAELNKDAYQTKHSKQSE